MKRPVTNPLGKTVELDTDVYLNGEIQYAETEYDCVLWMVDDSDLQAVKMECLKDLKILTVKESSFNRALALKELGYYE